MTARDFHIHQISMVSLGVSQLGPHPFHQGVLTWPGPQQDASLPIAGASPPTQEGPETTLQPRGL